MSADGDYIGWWSSWAVTETRGETAAAKGEEAAAAAWGWNREIPLVTKLR